MTKNKRILFRLSALICVALLTAACSKTAQNSVSVPEVTFEEATPGFKITDSFNDIHAVQLELYDTCLVDKVRRIVEVDNDRLLVLAKNEFYVFNKNSGSFVNKIGRVGEGPDEYLDITDFYYNSKDKTINIIDTYTGKVVRYGIMGDFISKEKADFPIDWMTSLTRSDNGYMLISHKLTGGMLGPSEFAYTVVRPNGDSFSFDPFKPVVLGGTYATQFATRPSVVTGDRFTFFKFLNDTIFTMENGEISPEYKLSMKKPLPQKDIVAQSGDYFDFIGSMLRGGDYMPGFDYIYETSKYIVLVPYFFTEFGYFWIDKTSGTGIHFPSSGNYELTMELLLKGESIFEIVGCNNNSLICAITSIDSAKKCLSEKPDLACFNEEVKKVFENANPEGNPVVIIYSH